MGSVFLFTFLSNHVVFTYVFPGGSNQLLTAFKNNSSLSTQPPQSDTIPTTADWRLTFLIVILSIILLAMIVLVFVPTHVKNLLCCICQDTPADNFNYIDIALYKTRHSIYRKEIYSQSMRMKKPSISDKRLSGCCHDELMNQPNPCVAIQSVCPAAVQRPSITCNGTHFAVAPAHTRPCMRKADSIQSSCKSTQTLRSEVSFDKVIENPYINVTGPETQFPIEETPKTLSEQFKVTGLKCTDLTNMHVNAAEALADSHHELKTLETDV